jgi:hypothetical protein
MLRMRTDRLGTFVECNCRKIPFAPYPANHFVVQAFILPPRFSLLQQLRLIQALFGATLCTRSFPARSVGVSRHQPNATPRKMALV